MSIEGQGHFFTIYFPGFVCFVLYFDKISGERLQDHWSSGLSYLARNTDDSVFCNGSLMKMVVNITSGNKMFPLLLTHAS